MAKIYLTSAEYFELFAHRYESQTTLMNHFAFGKPLKETDSFNITMTHYVWPMSFHVNFSLFYSIKRDMEAKLETVYKTMDKVPQFDASAMMQDRVGSLPVAVQHRGKWNRGLLQNSIMNEARVYFVDIGKSELVVWEKIRPLYKQFVEWPPLAFSCRLNGLNQADINESVIRTMQKAMPEGREFFCHVRKWNNMESILMDLYLGERNRLLIVNVYLEDFFERKRQQVANRMLAQKKLQEEKQKRRMLLGDDWDSSDED
ncbi:Tudor domain-containing protein 15 [Trichinella zimbabwensis]|uniref:Tudor domain-containing protein 15 n=1 Tax=Trichinella zimbabwensis TaxID=268475 RepID=A0A0V1GYJ3_9BILA|nr:Tudor domain-containing protein 15 [Trichinella zimbabwensis]